MILAIRLRFGILSENPYLFGMIQVRKMFYFDTFLFDLNKSCRFCFPSSNSFFKRIFILWDIRNIVRFLMESQRIVLFCIETKFKNQSFMSEIKLLYDNEKENYNYVYIFKSFIFILLLVLNKRAKPLYISHALRYILWYIIFFLN